MQTRIPPKITAKGCKKKRYPIPEIDNARKLLHDRFGLLGGYSYAVAEEMGVSNIKVFNIANNIITDPDLRKQFLEATERVLSNPFHNSKK